MDCRLPGSSVHGISQARTLEWVAISSSTESSQPRDWTLICCVFCIAGGFFLPPEPPGKPQVDLRAPQIIYLSQVGPPCTQNNGKIQCYLLELSPSSSPGFHGLHSMRERCSTRAISRNHEFILLEDLLAFEKASLQFSGIETPMSLCHKSQWPQIINPLRQFLWVTGFSFRMKHASPLLSPVGLLVLLTFIWTKAPGITIYIT